MKRIIANLKYAAPDVSFALYFVGTLVLGSIYLHWFLALLVAGITLKNRLQAVDQMETPFDGY